jgi:hypothetical protein
MKNSLKRFRFLIIVRLTLVVVIFLSIPRQAKDPDFDGRIERPADPATASGRPVVLIDQTYLNVQTMTKRCKPFADLIGNDGADVRPTIKIFTAKTLAGAEIPVVANLFFNQRFPYQEINEQDHMKKIV